MLPVKPNLHSCFWLRIPKVLVWVVCGLMLTPQLQAQFYRPATGEFFRKAEILMVQKSWDSAYAEAGRICDSLLQTARRSDSLQALAGRQFQGDLRMEEGFYCDALRLSEQIFALAGALREPLKQAEVFRIRAGIFRELERHKKYCQEWIGKSLTAGRNEYRYFTIDAVSVDSGQWHIRAKAGLRDLIDTLSVAEVIAMPSETNKERREITIGTARMRWKNQMFTGWEVQHNYTRDSNLLVRSGDQLRLQVQVPENAVGATLLAPVLYNNVRMTDADKVLMLDPFEVCDTLLKYADQPMVAAYTESVADIWNRFQNSDEATLARFRLPIRSGLFGGKTILEVIQNPKPVYIRAFLSFMKDNMNMYAGQEFRFAEIYATWMLYGAPLRARPLAELLSSLDQESIKETVLKFDSLIAAGGYGLQWRNYGEELVDAERFADSRRMERVLHNAADALGRTELRAHANYIRAYRNEYYGRSDSAEFYYYKAAAIYEGSGQFDHKITMEGCIANLRNSENIRVQVQTGHQLGFVLRMSPDGTRFATGGKERHLKVWDTRSVMELFSLEGHQAEIRAIEWSPDSRRLISADKVGKLNVWDIGTRRVVLSRYFPEGIRSIRLSPDGDFVAVLPFGKEVYLLHSGDLSDKFVLRGHEKNVQTALFIPGKRLLLTCDYDKKLIRWNLENGKKLETLDMPALSGGLIYNKVYDILGAICADTAIHIWRLKFPTGTNYLGRYSGHQVRVDKGGYGDTMILVSPATFSADGRMLIYQRSLEEISIYNLRTNREKRYKAFNEYIQQFELSADGKTLAAVGRFGSLYLTNLSRYDFYNSNELDIRRIEFPAAAITDACFVPGKNLLWIGHYTEGSRLLDLKVGKTQSMPEVFTSGAGKTFTADGNKFLTCRFEGTKFRAELRSLQGDSVLAVIRAEADLDRQSYSSLAPDGSSLALRDVQANHLCVQRFADGDTLVNFSIKKANAGGTHNTTTTYSSDSRHIAAAMGKYLYRFPLDGSSRYHQKKLRRKVEFIQTVRLQDKDVIMLHAAKKKLEFRDFHSWKPVHRPIRLHEGIIMAVLSADGQRVYTSGYNGLIRSVSMDNPRSRVDSFRTGRYCPNIDLSADGKSLLVADIESVYLLDPNNLHLQGRVIPIKGQEPVILDAEYHYLAPVRSLEGVAFEYRRKFFPPDQFDLNFNRPDLVLTSLGRADSTLVKAYRKAWEKRVRRTGIDPSALRQEWQELPELRLVNPRSIPLVTSVRRLEFQLRFEDRKELVTRLICWINGVPVSGSTGWNLPHQRKEDLLRISIPLSQGQNKVQVAVVNAAGISSLRETFYVRYDPPAAVKPNLHVVAMSVSSYADSSMDLKYAVKDGRDLVQFFTSDSTRRQLYGRITVDTLFNHNATREKFSELRSKLERTSSDDHVILYVSGHGLLDRDYNFWYATHDMNFNDPASRGIAYEDLEGLLDGIPARKRLFLIDACHSGEVDKEEVRAITAAVGGSLTLGTRGGRAVNIASRNEQLGSINTFELMKEMFADASGSGSSVLAASAGTSFALESDEWRNGIFTYALLHGLRDKAADQNGDGSITVNELNAYVSTEVYRRTRGLQKPAARRLDPLFDWTIW